MDSYLFVATPGGVQRFPWSTSMADEFESVASTRQAHTTFVPFPPSPNQTPMTTIGSKERVFGVVGYEWFGRAKRPYLFAGYDVKASKGGRLDPATELNKRLSSWENLWFGKHLEHDRLGNDAAESAERLAHLKHWMRPELLGPLLAAIELEVENKQLLTAAPRPSYAAAEYQKWVDRLKPLLKAHPKLGEGPVQKTYFLLNYLEKVAKQLTKAFWGEFGILYLIAREKTNNAVKYSKLEELAVMFMRSQVGLSLFADVKKLETLLKANEFSYQEENAYQERIQQLDLSLKFRREFITELKIRWESINRMLVVEPLPRREGSLYKRLNWDLSKHLSSLIRAAMLHEMKAGLLKEDLEEYIQKHTVGGSAWGGVVGFVMNKILDPAKVDVRPFFDALTQRAAPYFNADTVTMEVDSSWAKAITNRHPLSFAPEIRDAAARDAYKQQIAPAQLQQARQARQAGQPAGLQKFYFFPLRQGHLQSEAMTFLELFANPSSVDFEEIINEGMPRTSELKLKPPPTVFDRIKKNFILGFGTHIEESSSVASSATIGDISRSTAKSKSESEKKSASTKFKWPFFFWRKGGSSKTPGKPQLLTDVIADVCQEMLMEVHRFSSLKRKAPWVKVFSRLSHFPPDVPSIVDQRNQLLKSFNKLSDQRPRDGWQHSYKPTWKKTKRTWNVW